MSDDSWGPLNYVVSGGAAVPGVPEFTYMLFANPNFDHVLMWDGSSQFAAIQQSPANIAYIKVYNQRLYMSLTLSTRVVFSEPADPANIPVNNNFDIPAAAGQITGFASDPNGLIIFTTNSILLLRGDPPLNFTVQPLAQHIGCQAPQSISTLGATTMFVFNGAVLATTNGEVQTVSAKLRGSSYVPNLGPICWGVLTPAHYILGFGTISGALGILVFDRVRFQAWSLWVYPSTTSVGTTPPDLPVLCAPDDSGFVIASGDGNVYFQPFRLEYGYSGYIDDAVDVPVHSEWKSRTLWMGDPNLQKDLREVIVAGDGTNASVTVDLFDPNQVMAPIVMAISTTLPVACEGPEVDGDTGNSVYSQIQVDVQADSCWLRGVSLTYRPIRYGLMGLD